MERRLRKWDAMAKSRVKEIGLGGLQEGGAAADGKEEEAAAHEGKRPADNATHNVRSGGVDVADGSGEGEQRGLKERQEMRGRRGGRVKEKIGRIHAVCVGCRYYLR